MDGINFDDLEVDWLDKPATAETPVETETPTAEDIAAAAEDKPATVVSPPAETTDKLDEPPAIPVSQKIVEDLGGEDAARQLLPLVRVLQEVDPENQQEAGKKLADGVRAVMDDTQWAAFLWDNFNNFGQIFTEQYLAENPNFLKEKGFVPATTTPVDDDQPDDPYAEEDDTLSPKEKALEARLNAAEARLAELTGKEKLTEEQKRQQAEEATREQVRSKANQAVFGDVVNKAFEELGWDDEEARNAFDLAMAKFQRDAGAQEAYQKSVRYHATGNKLLAGFQVTAKTTFAKYLDSAIKTVGAGRTATAVAKTPIPPGREEITSTAPGMNTATEGSNNGNLFTVDPNALLAAVENRLRSSRAAR